MTNREQIINQAISFLKEAPHRIRYSDFVRKINLLCVDWSFQY